MFSEGIAETSEIACPERYLPFREAWISGGSQTLAIALMEIGDTRKLCTLCTLFTLGNVAMLC